MKEKKSDLDVLKKVRWHVQNGTYILAKHAIQRQEERGIKLPDVLLVLEKGWHEENKDRFDVRNQCWKHAIRGKTIDGVDLRIVVAFEKRMVVITVIRIG